MDSRERAGVLATSPHGFLSALEEITALSPARLAAIRAGIDSGACLRDPALLARGLIGHGAITEFQARFLLHGRASDLLVGRYVIADRIGRGSMGRVYRATHPVMGREVALKVIDLRLAGDTGTVARFRREMRMVGRLDHPNVVRAYDADRVGDRLFIAMELVRGASLDAILLRRGPMPPAEVVRHAAQAAAGLAHAHERGIIHRDVKPSNLLLDERGAVKVLDFGLGVLADRDDSDGFATDASFVVGTANFLSPEQACSRPLDGRSDLYSLGCTMYYLLSGSLPFDGGSALERIAARLVGRATPISDVRPGLPRSLIEAIERLMARRPEDRFSDAFEASRALRRLIRQKAAAVPGCTQARPALASPAPAEARIAPGAPDPVETPIGGESRIPRLLRALMARARRLTPRPGVRATA